MAGWRPCNSWTAWTPSICGISHSEAGLAVCKRCCSLGVNTTKFCLLVYTLFCFAWSFLFVSITVLIVQQITVHFQSVILHSEGNLAVYKLQHLCWCSQVLPFCLHIFCRFLWPYFWDKTWCSSHGLLVFHSFSQLEFKAAYCTGCNLLVLCLQLSLPLGYFYFCMTTWKCKLKLLWT